MKLTVNARKVVEARFLARNESFEIIETPEGMCERVASAVAAAETDSPKRQHWKEKFLTAIDSLEFLPNSPTLANAGTSVKQLSACYVLPVEDSMEKIFDALKWMALVQQSGGGTGFDFSELRPAGTRVSRTGGKASGPVSFMQIFDAATENIRQGGRRRGANMGILRIDHPDIEAFIEAKRNNDKLRNFNLSIGITDAFLSSLGKSSAADSLFQKIVESAWATGDPGLLFLDRINETNPTPHIGRITATNPCGEVPLLPFEACNLGSIHLGKCIREGQIDWRKLESLTELGVRFLDNVIEISEWPVPQIKERVRGNRKIGLGVMGFADFLIHLKISYGGPESIQVAEQVMAFIRQKADEVSIALAEERGVFANWKGSVYSEKGVRIRNATRISIAPTGTIGIVAGTSAGIEPLFALAYRRSALDGQTMTEINPLFVEAVKEYKDSSRWIAEVVQKGSLSKVNGIPESIQNVFVTALELSAEAHLGIQEVFQKHTDNAVSKTINLPQNATTEDVRYIYLEAAKRHLKGITVFRYGSKGTQVLELGADENGETKAHFVKCDPNEC